MSIKVEAALITQKRPDAVFNTDSFNINGRGLSRSDTLKGYKGSGTMSGSVRFALASSECDGAAEAAVKAFNECTADFSPEKNNVVNMLDAYFDKCRVITTGADGKNAGLSAAVFFASEKKAVAADCGKAEIYLLSKGVFTAVNTKKTAEKYGFAEFDSISAGDMFLMVGPGIGEALTDKDIEDACRLSEGSVKKTVSVISRAALIKSGANAVSVIAIKISELSPYSETAREEALPELVFVGENDEDIIRKDRREITEKSIHFSDADGGTVVNDSENYDDDVPVNDDEKSGKRKKVTAILAVLALLLLIAVAAGLFAGGIFNSDKETTLPVFLTDESTTLAEPQQETTDTNDGTTLSNETTTNGTTQEESSSREESAAGELTTRETTTREATTRETTTRETTTRETTTRESTTEEPTTEESTTEEPATEEPTTEEPATEEPTTEEPAAKEPRTEVI